MDNDEWINFSDFDDLSEIEPDVANDPRVKLNDDITRAKQDLQIMSIEIEEVPHHQDLDEEQTEQRNIEEIASGDGDDEGSNEENDDEEQREQNKIEEQGNGDEHGGLGIKSQRIEVRNDDPSWPSWLPEDWRFIMIKRIHGKTKGVVDKFYISTGGRKFRSKKRALEYIEKQWTKQQCSQLKEKSGTSHQSQT